MALRDRVKSSLYTDCVINPSRTDVYLNHIAYKTLDSTSQRTQSVSIVKTNR